MSVRFSLRIVLALGCVLPATFAVSQALPAIPPSLDPTFWGRANAPYTLKITSTNTSVTANSAPQTHVMVMNVFRDSEGLVREEFFYDNGRPHGVSIRDPRKNTITIMYVATKSAVVAPTYQPVTPPPGRGWAVERLPSRIIDGSDAEGLRFTRAIPAPADGNGAPATIVEEEWVSNELGVVLEQTTYDSRTGTTTKTVSQFKQAEPDSTLFKIDLTGYSVQQVGTFDHSSQIGHY
jgi:hypothetical protein